MAGTRGVALAPGFDAAASVLTGDFDIALP
jgi:hypothetical protein